MDKSALTLNKLQNLFMIYKDKRLDIICKFILTNSLPKYTLPDPEVPTSRLTLSTMKMLLNITEFTSKFSVQELRRLRLVSKLFNSSINLRVSLSGVKAKLKKMQKYGIIMADFVNEYKILGFHPVDLFYINDLVEVRRALDGFDINSSYVNNKDRININKALFLAVNLYMDKLHWSIIRRYELNISALRSYTEFIIKSTVVCWNDISGGDGLFIYNMYDIIESKNTIEERKEYLIQLGNIVSKDIPRQFKLMDFCAVCAQGSRYVCKDSITGEYMAICEECDASWFNPFSTGNFSNVCGYDYEEDHRKSYTIDAGYREPENMVDNLTEKEVLSSDWKYLYNARMVDVIY